MVSFKEMESNATDYGFIPNEIYDLHAARFRVCPKQDKDIEDAQNDIWEKYLKATRWGKRGENLYNDMFRYEWYEGRKRTGFWGHIEDAIRTHAKGDAPRISVLSAGSGRDLLKVGLAAGVWSSCAPEKIKGTYREIDMDYFRLEKPGARFIVTEFGEGNLNVMKKTVSELMDRKLINADMIGLSRWDFREKAPVVTDSQDLIVFSLTGFYSGEQEQPLILKEIARCVKPRGFLIASTLSPTFDFIKAKGLGYRLKFILKTPLGWPIGLAFMRWQVNWAKMAGAMNRRGIWANTSALTWAEWLKPEHMKTVRIYDPPCDLVPVEVLVMQKKRHTT